MILTYQTRNSVLHPNGADLPDALWIDLLHPTPEDEKTVEASVNFDIPTRAEMEEIEISSRLYSQGEATFMTAILPANSDEGDPEMGPVTFILTPGQLITVRYHTPRVFESFPLRAAKTAQPIFDAETLLVSLLEAIIDREADILERAAKDIDALSRRIFNAKGARIDHQVTLERVGQMGILNSNIRDSILTMERLVGHLSTLTARRDSNADLRERVKTLASDARSLTDHAGFLGSKITFLLDATLGMINIEQSATIKIFSVAAVIFLPPTLVASIYGMNFRVMPELGWLYGYPFAIGMMVLFAVLPYLYFKYRKWL